MGYHPNDDWPTETTSTIPWISERLDQVERLRQKAREALEWTASMMKRKAGGAIPTLSEGDHVWLEGKNLHTAYPTAKLAPRRHGPFEITEKLSPVTYRLKLPPTMKIHDVFHASLLTPYKETKEHGPNFTHPPPDLVDDEEEYEVESIRNSRWTGGTRPRLEYLVKWKGYPESDNQWEPAAHLDNAADLVTRYHEEHPSAAGPKTTSKRRGQRS